MEDSIFTKIIRGEIPCHKIYEDDYTFAFLDIHPQVEAHTLLVPKEQVDHLWDLDQAAVLGAAQKQRRTLKRPPMEAGSYLEMLMRQGLVQTSKVLGPYGVML